MKNNIAFLNSSFAALSQIIIFIVGMLLPKIFLNTYGSEINGMVTSIYQFVSYINLLEAGLGAASIFMLYKPLAQKNYDKVNAILYSIKNHYKTLSIYFLAILIILSFTYPLFLKTNALPYLEIVFLVIVLGLGSILEFLIIAKYRIFLIAEQKVYIISIATIISTVSNFFITYILCKLYWDVTIVKSISLVSFILKIYFLNFYLNKHYQKINFKNLDTYEKINIPNKGNAFLVQLFSLISISIPIVCVTFTQSLISVSIFSIYNMVCMGIVSIISIFSTGMSSVLGRFYVNDDFKKLNLTYDKFEFIMLFIMSVLIGCLLSLIYSFVTVYTKNINDAIYAIQSYAILFPLWTLSHIIRIPQDTLITASGKFKQIKNINLTQIILFVTLPFLSSLYFGINGILISVILINFMRYTLLIIFVNKHIIKMPNSKLAFRFSALSISICLTYLISLTLKLTKIDSISQFFYYGVIIFILSTICTFICFYFKDKSLIDEYMYKFSSFIKIIKSKVTF